MSERRRPFANRNNGLPDKHQAAIVALLNCKNVTDAAEMAQMGESTLRQWLMDPDFRKQYDKARNEVFSMGLAHCRKHFSAAIDTLISICNTGKKESSRVQAAKAIIDTSFRASELEDILKRIEELEGKLGEMATKALRKAG